MILELLSWKIAIHVNKLDIMINNNKKKNGYVIPYKKERSLMSILNIYGKCSALKHCVRACMCTCVQVLVANWILNGFLTEV